MTTGMMTYDIHPQTTPGFAIVVCSHVVMVKVIANEVAGCGLHGRGGQKRQEKKAHFNLGRHHFLSFFFLFFSYPSLKFVHLIAETKVALEIIMTRWHCSSHQNMALASVGMK